MNSNPETTHAPRCGGRLHRHWGKARFLIPLFVVAFILAKAAATMLLWNALIPGLFHGPLLNFPQALGLLVLAKLFVGFGHGRHFGGGPGRHFGWRGRFLKMSPEEREKLRAEFLRRSE